MRDFTFEYTDTKFILKLSGLSFSIFVVLLFTMIKTAHITGNIFSLILIFGIPLLIFFWNKNKIKKCGGANIYESYSDFKLANSTKKVFYSDIRTYQVERYNGTFLKIKFKDKTSFNLHANSHFCESGQFDTFCREFENMIQIYKSSNNVKLARRPSMFERAWIFPLLIILTSVLIGGIIFASYHELRIPPSFYTSAAIIIPLWLGYLNARKRKHENQN